MDLDKIIQELNQRFAAPLKEFYKRRIIFWYDAEGEFRESISDIVLDNAKILILTGTNNFAAKKLLSVDDTASNYLVYCPLSYDDPKDNWLLDIELYSEDFRGYGADKSQDFSRPCKVLPLFPRRHSHQMKKHAASPSKFLNLRTDIEIYSL